MINNVKTYNYPVSGMTCASCVARVEKVLNKFDGIENVKVNYGTETVSFDVTNQDINLEKAVNKLDEFGYSLKIQNETDIKKDYSKDEGYEKLKSEFKFALILTIPIFFISMFSGHIESWPLSADSNNKILFLLTTPLIFVAGKRFFITFWKNLKHFSFEMNSLVAIGTGSAYIYSTIVTIFPEVLKNDLDIQNHVYFETAAVIITLILMGKLLESRAKKKTNTAIQKLMELKPKTAVIIENGIEKTISIEELVSGNKVLIRPGDRLPADGIIIEGFSTLNESMITGESLPVEKNIGSKVIGGTINKNGSFTYEITTIGDNSVLGQIIKLVEEAQGSKAPIQKLADKVAAVFVPSVIGFSILTLIGWLVFGSENILANAIINFVAVLIIACPCALGLATPTAIMVGTGEGAKNGILIKNGESLELAHKIDTIVLDKTGTITEGHPKVTDIITQETDKDTLLSLTASLEKKSQHPIAEAILESANSKNLELYNISSFVNHEGMGISAEVDNEIVIAGNSQFMENSGIKFDPFKTEYDKLASEGKSVVFVAKGGVLIGLIAVEDPIKSSSNKAIDNFNKLGLNVYMLTGDNLKTANAIASRIGIKNIIAEVLPDQKAKCIKDLQASGKIVTMVGDGINDAPALAQADLGIAIGSGTDVAIESSDFTLIKGELNDVVAAIKLSKRTIRTIKQNLFWAFIYNIIGIPLAALGLLNPMIGALAMALSSVSVISNSLRLKNMEL